MNNAYISTSSPWQATPKDVLNAGGRWAALKHCGPSRMELTIGDDNRQPIDVSPVNTPKDGCGFIGFLATPLLKEKDAHEEFNVFVRMIEEGLIEEVVFDLRRIHISMSRALLRKECTSIDSLF